MSTNPSIIVGAGLAGLIAAHAWPSAAILERGPEPRAAHRALLRFRSDKVAKLTGVEFRPVKVRKGIWCDGRFREPTIQLANWYAQKVTGGRLVAERSIWNLDPVERFIAPDDLYEQLLDAVGRRVAWAADWSPDGTPTVSTAPLSETVKWLTLANAPDFHRAGIEVARFDLGPDVDVHQTVYFPHPETPLYRASITGRTLIAEFMGGRSWSGEEPGESWETLVEAAFGLTRTLPPRDELASQRFGKIAPLADDGARKHLLFRLTHELNVYSLGRFATWRNILLDDVVDDIASIKRLMKSGAGAYDVRRATA